MSIKVKIDDINAEIVSNDLHIEVQPPKFSKVKSTKLIIPYRITDDYAYLPFGYTMELMEMNNKKDIRPTREAFPKSEFSFSAILRDNQEEIKNRALRFLNKKGVVMISAYPGFGKTITAIKLVSLIKLPALVITKGLPIIKQWKESIERFSPNATCQILKSNERIKIDQNFYIVNAINNEKIDSRLLKRIGIVVVDEAHQIMSEILSRSLTHVTPRYLIGLTATPYRYDDYDALLGLYFGIKNDRKISIDVNRERIHPLIYIPLNVDHIVYRINTGFKPTIELGSNGKVDWNTVLESQADDINRNERIIKLVKFFGNRVFLIMCKRITQADYLLQRLKEEGEDVTSLFGIQKEYRKESRILIGTNQKVGTGFDHPRLDTLLLASDTLNYYIQNLGRVCRSPNIKPMFFDLVDDYSLLISHYKQREKVYIEHGGKIRRIEEDYPSFKF